MGKCTVFSSGAEDRWNGMTGKEEGRRKVEWEGGKILYWHSFRPLLLATHPSTTNYIHDPFAVCSG